MRSGCRHRCLALTLLAAAACSQDFSVFRFDRKPTDQRAATRPDAGLTTPPDASAAGESDGAQPERPLVAAGADAAAPPDAATELPSPGDGSAADGGDGGSPAASSGKGGDAAPPSGASGGGRGGAGAGGTGGSDAPLGGASGRGDASDAAVDLPDAEPEPVDSSFEPIDAGADPTDAGEPAAAPQGLDSARRAAGADASAGEAPAIDGGDPRLGLCRAGWDQQLGASGACRDCACAVCADPILDCLLRGDEAERARCSAVLACAVRNHCQDYACYCRTTGCGRPASVGDGPCAELVNAAAGGTRSRVTALRSAEPVDPNEPLIRASQAIACIYGVHAASPGPTLEGRCSGECG